MTSRGFSPGRMTALGAAVLAAVLGLITRLALSAVGDDPAQRRAVALAAAIVGGSSLAGWVVSRQGRGQGAAPALASGLGATLVRLGPMLVALAWITTAGGEWREAGAAGWLVAFYLPMLLADIGLTLLARPGGPWDGGGETPN
jgi:hypothetical protein